MWVYVLKGEPQDFVTRSYVKAKDWSGSKQAIVTAGITIEGQHDNRPIITGPILVDVIFYFKFTHKDARTIERGPTNFTSPSLISLFRFIEEISTGIVFDRASSIAAITMKKVYDENPRTEITIRKK